MENALEAFGEVAADGGEVPAVDQAWGLKSRWPPREKRADMMHSLRKKKKNYGKEANKGRANSGSRSRALEGPVFSFKSRSFTYRRRRKTEGGEIKSTQPQLWDGNVGSDLSSTPGQLTETSNTREHRKCRYSQLIPSTRIPSLYVEKKQQLNLT